MTAIAEKNMPAATETLSAPVPATILPFRSSSTRDRVTPAKLGIQSLISAGTTFTGNIESDSGMKIDGNIVGNVTVRSETDAWVVVAETSVIEGTVTGRVVAICGRVKGLIRAKHVVLMPTAKIDGDLYYEVLRVSDGAQMNGHLNHVGNGAQADGQLNRVGPGRM